MVKIVKAAPPEPGKERQAFSVERAPGGWSMVTLTYNDQGIVKTEKTEPDLKAITLEKYKIASFKYWSTIG